MSRLLPEAAALAGGQASPSRLARLSPTYTDTSLSCPGLLALPARHLEDFTDLFMNISHYILDVIILLRIN